MTTSDWLDAIDHDLDTLSGALPLWTDQGEPCSGSIRLWQEGWDRVRTGAAAHEAVLIDTLATAVLGLLTRAGHHPEAMTQASRRQSAADAVEQALATLAALVADHGLDGSGQDTEHVQALIDRLDRIAGDLALLTLAALREQAEALTRGLESVEQSLAAVVGQVDWLRDRVFALGDALDLRMVARSGQVGRPGTAGDPVIDREQVEALGQGLDAAIQQLSSSRAALVEQVAGLAAAVAAQRALLEP